MSTDNLKDEYLDASANMRYYGNARFAILTLFIAITAGLFTAIFGDQVHLAATLKAFLKLGGVLLAIAFCIMEERATRYYRGFRRRAVELEKILDFKQYTNSPEQRVITSTNSVRLMYGMFVLFWVISLFF
jgi:hypothetical protein